jgi:glycosyltransferase involved in cell wall biosynthesis
MKGFDLAKGDLIGFVDSDKSTSPEEFFKLYLNIGDNYGIIGSRKTKGAIVEPKRNFSKRVGSFGFSFVSKLLFMWNYQDTQCGAKIFKKDVAKYFPDKIVEKGWIFDVDLLYLCKKKNWKIKEFPIRWVDDEGSHISSLDGIKSILRLIKYRIIS